MKLEEYIDSIGLWNLSDKLEVRAYIVHNWKYKKSKPNAKHIVVLVDSSEGILNFEQLVREVASWT